MSYNFLYVKNWTAAVSFATAEESGETCVAPSNLTSTGTAAHSIDITWTENGTATSWTVYYRVNGASSWITETANATTYSFVSYNFLYVKNLKTKSNGFIDVKSPFSISNISDCAKDASKQNAIVCITDDHCVLDSSKIQSYANHIFKNTSYTKDEVHFIINGNLHKLQRPKK